jgi:hypothetical protein
MALAMPKISNIDMGLSQYLNIGNRAILEKKRAVRLPVLQSL